MEEQSTKIGSSLMVPLIQELANNTLTTIPSRFLINDEDQDSIPVIDSSEQALPVIDMQKLLSADFMDSELQKLDQACKAWGFFLLMNHGVDSSLVEKVKVEIQEFFNLPMEEKEKFWQRPGETEGFGQNFVVSEEQKLEWGYGFTMFTLPAYLRKPHLFPKLPLPLRFNTYDIHLTALILFAYAETPWKLTHQKLENLALKILNQMAKALKMDPNDIKEPFEEGVQSMRMNFYPPCPQPDQVIGFNPHSDAAALTILLQLNEMDGLQIKKDGMWFPVKPLPDTFVINVGDIFEIFTNGIYRSIEHRAITNSMKERLSIATFYGTKLDGEVGPASSLITPKTPALFRRIGMLDYTKGFMSRKLYGKSNIDYLRVQNEDSKSY